MLHACRATHAAIIVAARKALSTIPADWLRQYLREVVDSQLDMNDEWEFRRLLELLEIVQPAQRAYFIKTGRTSRDGGVRAAAEDYSAGRYGPIEGLD